MIAAIQAGLRWLFMHVEALFNARFRRPPESVLPPGSIAFYLFWIVAFSGLYLYAFFDTGVAQAYASVNAITHGQWYFGGILRSVHRYASDAMVVIMLVHLVRHFAFDRMRGFRAFSWLTGVGLIWLVYVSGINGYMLPWDRLAQFVIIASFEWLDWLPSFGGALIRNFIYPSSVNDRLFSLLSFIHIGAPLLVLLLMWVHVQRVPKASTQPPRPIALGVLAMLLVLSLLLPVTSQGGAADLSTEVTSVALDWFLSADLSTALSLEPGTSVVAARIRHAGPGAAAVAGQAAPCRRATRIPVGLASGLQAGLGAGRRNRARSRAARRAHASLRVPQRRLRRVRLHGTERERRSWRIPASDVDGGDARRRQGSHVLRDADRGCGNRDRRRQPGSGRPAGDPPLPG